MKNKLHLLLTGFGVCLAGISYGQALLTPALRNYALFTSNGAVTNTETSTIKGNLGTNVGSVTGFPGYANSGTTTVSGTINVQNDETLARAADVQTAYNSLITTATDFIVTNPTFGNGQSLGPGTYFLGEAGSVVGTLTLTGSVNDIFIIKIGGALSAAEGSQVVLSGGAVRENVYFNVSGQVSLATGAVFNGNIVSSGAIILESGASLNGRGLTTAGEINLSGNNVDNGLTSLPVRLTSFIVKKGEFKTAELTWTTAAETNSESFQIQRSSNGKIWASIGSVAAKGESNISLSYNFTDGSAAQGTNMYRLKMIDRDETFAYSSIKSIEFAQQSRTVLYPNPTIDKLTLDVEDMNNIQRIQLTNILGASVYNQSKTTASPLSPSVDTKALATGLYLVRVTRTDGSISVSKIVKN
ncbi:ice-binding family protein [Dyadobacter psychrotolerans]|uniref:DUF3494 domain-containing protein n=1 Tax=Dyadobacter psychrotolerans TaxID=2541721 RepID=A0A4R5DMG9_9BACT|nr:ice-binding family protein [Dyadobacter psychrotolerans]TDE15476.1 DUF3494 domain-containing protein [Dyadobacter psychrotolerans]